MMRCGNDRVKQISEEIREIVVIGAGRSYDRMQR